MLIGRRGFATIDALMALTLLSIGGLAAAGTTMLSLRAAHEGKRTARAARLLEGMVDHFAATIASASGRCDAIVAGSDSNGLGETVRWSLIEQPHGLGVTVELSYGPSSRQRPDSAWSFVRCL